MAESELKTIARDGLWTNNVGLVQLLGLCPLLAITSSLVNAIGLGLATTFTLVVSSVTISLIRKLVRPEVRIPVFVVVIASTVTVVQLVMNAYFHELYKILGIFIALIVTNCAIIGRAEAFASKQPVLPTFIDALTMGVGFTLVLMALGGMREIIGQGTLFANAHLMFGEAARGLDITILADYRGFLIAILPPGAFIGLGLLIALKNIIDGRLHARPRKLEEPEAAPASQPV